MKAFPESDQKPLYHAAACIASIMVTLFALSLAVMEVVRHGGLARAALSQLSEDCAELTDRPRAVRLTDGSRGATCGHPGHLEALKIMKPQCKRNRMLGLETVVTR